MAFTLPVFNLAINVWRNGAGIPPVGPPDVFTVGNLAWGKRVQFLWGADVNPGVTFLPSMTLLLPAGTDVRGIGTTSSPDTVEAPAGSGRFYVCVFVDDLGKGFANEHRGAVLVQSPAWPIPTP